MGRRASQLLLVLGVLSVVSGCGGGDSGNDESMTASTTAPPEEVAFRTQYEIMPEEMKRNFSGKTPEQIALSICSDSAELMYVGRIGVEHYPDVARAGYAWKCPDRVEGHDAAVLRAIAEDARRREAAPSPSASNSGGSPRFSVPKNTKEHCEWRYNVPECSYSADMDQWIPFPN